VLEIAVREGDDVQAQAVVARLDDTLERLGREMRAADLRAAHAQLDLLLAGSRKEDVRALQASLRAAKSAESLAKQTLAREEKIATGGIGRPADLDAARSQHASATANRQGIDAQLRRAIHGARPEEIAAATARVDAAEAAVKTSDERIARHVLRAAEAGHVLDVLREPGEFTSVGAPVLRMADVRHPYVDVFVPEGDMAALDLGGAAQVRVDSLEEPLAATVEHISSRTEFTPRFLFSERERPDLVIRVRVRVDDPDARLHAGLPAFVTESP
jgi:HlyD family secretion protein